MALAFALSAAQARALEGDSEEEDEVRNTFSVIRSFVCVVALTFVNAHRSTNSTHKTLLRMRHTHEVGHGGCRSIKSARQLPFLALHSKPQCIHLVS